MGIAELINEYGWAITAIIVLVIVVGLLCYRYLNLQFKTIREQFATTNKSIEKHDQEQRELRGMVTDLIQSMGDIKQSMGRLEGMMIRQQDQTDSKQTAPDGSTL